MAKCPPYHTNSPEYSPRERNGYWRTCLEAAVEPERAAPTKERAEEIEAEITDLERRLTRQLVNLEADDVTAALRRRVGQRVAELEDAIADRRERLVALARESATEEPTWVDVAPLLDRLPILATRSTPRLRANYGRCSTRCSSTSSTSRPTAPSTSRSPSTIAAGTLVPGRRRLARRTGWLAPPAGLEPAPPAPEAGALSTELRGQIVPTKAYGPGNSL